MADDAKHTPGWLERLEARTRGQEPASPEASDIPSGASIPARLPRSTPVVRSGQSPAPIPSRNGLGPLGEPSPVAELEETGVTRLRNEAIRAAREDAAAGVPAGDDAGTTQSERDLRERCRAFFDRWNFQHRRWLNEQVAREEEQITDRLGRASLAVDRFERLANELTRLKARRATRHREVTDELGGDEDARGLSTRVYLAAIGFLGLVEFFANAPVFASLLPRDQLTERQIRIVLETSEGWLAGAERVLANLILRPDVALLAAGVVTFLCVLAHFFGHSLRELVMLQDAEERHHTVAARSKLENVIPLVLTGLGLILVLGVLYEARIRLGEVGEQQYGQDVARVEELRRQAGFQVSDGNLLEANSLRNQADDLEAAAVALRDYSRSMSGLSFPILLLNLTLVICALSAAYFHRGDRRREHFNENPFERERLHFIESAEATAQEVTGLLSDLARRIRTLRSLGAASGPEEPRGVVRELESVIALYRAENGRARGMDPRAIPAFRTPVDLGIVLDPGGIRTLEPLRSPEEYDGERRSLQTRFEEARHRLNQEAVAW
ncbi:MAG: hypothetical protein ACRELC_09915 [Gemmatimonadota bacterium]